MPLVLLRIAESVGIPERFRKAFADFLAILFVVIIIGLFVFAFRSWVHGKQEQAVQLDRADITAEAAAKVINATSEATVNQMARDEAFAKDQKELQHEVANGTSDNVGPGVRSVLERMREQQAAGRRGASAAR